MQRESFVCLASSCKESGRRNYRPLQLFCIRCFWSINASRTSWRGRERERVEEDGSGTRLITRQLPRLYAVICCDDVPPQSRRTHWQPLPEIMLTVLAKILWQQGNQFKKWEIEQTISIRLIWNDWNFENIHLTQSYAEMLAYYNNLI